MSIISIAQLNQELPSDAGNSNNEKTKAIVQATSFCNTWAKNYLPFEDFDPSTGDTLAPDIIVRICLDIAVTFYLEAIGEVNRDGDQRAFLTEFREKKERELKEITIEPVQQTKTIAINADRAMLIDRHAEIIPNSAYVSSLTTNVWNPREDWFIRRGGLNDNEHFDSWYFYSNATDIEGTLTYFRTYRNDAIDYMRVRTKKFASFEGQR